jgi:DNA-binding NtrC family response regulator
MPDQTRGKLIFIIDQNSIVGLDLQTALEKSEYRVKKFNTIEKAGESFQLKKPDFVIADSEIQKHPDFESMKSVFAKERTPLICISTKENRQTIQICESINLVSIFQKPFNSSDLIETVDSYLCSNN